MNIRFLIIAFVLLAAIVFNRCSRTANNLSSQFVVGSKIDIIHFGEREAKFTEWLPNKVYKKRFKNKSRYYKDHKTYPVYVEVNVLGNRRVLEIPYEASFHWRVSSARVKDEFKKIHIKETLNRGKKLLSLHIMNKDGVDIYTGVWVSAEVFEREAKKLKKLGIETPFFNE